MSNNADSLQSLAEEPAREKLRRLGWTCVETPAGNLWRSPEPNDDSVGAAIAVLSEAHALAWLERERP